MGTSKTENRETLLISSPVPIICRIFHGTCARVGWKEGETWHRLSFSSFLLLLALSLITHPAQPGTSVMDASYRVVVTKLFPFTGATFSQNSFAINNFISLNSHLILKRTFSEVPAAQCKAITDEIFNQLIWNNKWKNCRWSMQVCLVLGIK